MLNLENFRRNDPTKVNNTEKPKEKVGQLSNNSMGQQCFGRSEEHTSELQSQ